VGPVELPAHERQVRPAPHRVPLAEDAAVHNADVEPAGLADERDLGADRAPQLADVVALKQRLDAVGRAHRQLEAAARADAAVAGDDRWTGRHIETDTPAEVVEALPIDIGVRGIRPKLQA